MDGHQLEQDNRMNSISECRTMQSIFDEVGVTHIDFFSLDVEGQEAHVLRSIDFERMTFDVIMLESDKSEVQSRILMSKHPQYKLHKAMVRRSDVYVRDAFLYWKLKSIDTI